MNDAVSVTDADSEALQGLVETRADGVLTLTLNRPAQANALSPVLVERLLSALGNLDGIHLCVFRGEGKHFSAGFDLSDLEQLSDGDLLHRFLRIETLLQRIHHLPVPTMALGHGRLVGAGADLLLACTHRFTAPGSSLSMPGWNFGLALGTRRLALIVGTDKALDILLDTRTVHLDEALELAMVSRKIPVDRWSETIAEMSDRCATLQPQATEQLLALTRPDTRDADLAAIVRTAGKPGLKQRLLDYRQQVMKQRAARAAGVSS